MVTILIYLIQIFNPSESTQSSVVLDNLRKATWKGTITQFDIDESWAVLISFNTKTNQFEAVYPTLGCKAHLAVVKATDIKGEFVETIDQGHDTCNDKGIILLELVNESRMTFSYFWPDKKTLLAKGDISKE